MVNGSVHLSLKNSSGSRSSPSTEPSGTALVTFFQLETLPLTTTFISIRMDGGRKGGETESGRR